MVRGEATLVLEDGTVLHGEGFGAPRTEVFEMVFNTSLTGYEEILSDPSYRGQAVVFTNPHIGNTGITMMDMESRRVQASAVVVRSLSPVVSSWRAKMTLPVWLEQYGVPGISGVDTRRLTRLLRDRGTLKAALSTEGAKPADLLERAQAWSGLDGVDTVRMVSCGEPYDLWEEPSQAQWAGKFHADKRVAALDFGIKRSILRMLAVGGAAVRVFPAWAKAEEVLAFKPDGIFLSNGPGDPSALPYAAETVAAFLETGLPVFGICLGHQLIGRALGGETGRLKFGHHGSNHPVRECRTGRALITAQNHNFSLDAATLDPHEVEITHLSLNDGTLEGMRLRHKPVFSVQFHPEAVPGPHDAHGLFENFYEMMQ